MLRTTRAAWDKVTEVLEYSRRCLARLHLRFADRVITSSHRQRVKTAMRMRPPVSAFVVLSNPGCSTQCVQLAASVMHAGASRMRHIRCVWMMGGMSPCVRLESAWLTCMCICLKRGGGSRVDFRPFGGGGLKAGGGQRGGHGAALRPTQSRKSSQQGTRCCKVT
jgi:hypothetical protein